MSDILETLPTVEGQPDVSEYAKMRALVKPYSPCSLSYKTYILLAILFLIFSFPFVDSILGKIFSSSSRILFSLVKLVVFLLLFYVLNRYFVK